MNNVEISTPSFKQEQVEKKPPVKKVKVYDPDNHKSILANYGKGKKSKSPRDINENI